MCILLGFKTVKQVVNCLLRIWRTHLERGVMIPGDMRALFRGEMYTLLLPGTRSGELGNL